MLKRFALALFVSAAVLGLTPALALASWHQHNPSNAATWQNPNGAANVTGWARLTYDESDGKPVFRETKFELRQTKNAGNVFVIARIRGYLCGHGYNTVSGSHTAFTHLHNWPGGGAWKTVPMQRALTSGTIYSFFGADLSQTPNDPDSYLQWHYLDGCNVLSTDERLRLEVRFDIYADSDGRFLATVPVNVQATL